MHRNKNRLFDQAISEEYEASLDPLHWPNALECVGRACGAWGIQLLAFDRASGTVPFSAVAGQITAEAEALYIEHFGRLDPRVPLVARMAVGDLMICHEHFGGDFVARSEFYQDFLIPNGGRYAVGAKLIDSHDATVIVGIHRSEDGGCFARADLWTFKALLPHLARAMRIRQSLEAARAETATVRMALDKISFGVVLTDQTGRISYANEAASSMLRCGSGLLSVGGRLAARMTQDDNALKAALRGSGGCVAIRRASAVGKLHLLVAPLPERAAASLDAARGTLMILIKDPENSEQPAATMIAAAFGLSRAEARVAEAIARGRTIQEIADETRASRNTIRVQVQAILDKTGAGRQAELVRMILGLPTARR
jgi:DNA-binding CsgD family transcriptional regulator/PAS domain-containing protein